MKIINNKILSNLLFFGLTIILLLLLLVTFLTSKISINDYYDLQIEASNKTLTCFNYIKEYKINHNLMGIEDKYNSGLIGYGYSEIDIDGTNSITTTEGHLESKLTSVNPNFAATYIKMFKNLNLKKGDKIGMMFSGSFPALNISAIIAAECYGLEYISMGSIGASTFGANNPEFNFFDYIELLYQNHLIKNPLDYVSFGGNHDDGSDFDQTIVDNIKQRINNSSSILLVESDYNANVEARMVLYGDIKCFLNVGGTVMAMGKSVYASTTYSGIVEPNYLRKTKDIYLNYDNTQIGLLDRYLNKGINVIQMLDLKNLATTYGLPYEATTYPEVGIYNQLTDNTYSDVTYNIIYPIIGLSLFLIIIIGYGIIKIKNKRVQS